MTDYSAFTAGLPRMVSDLQRAMADKDYTLSRSLLSLLRVKMTGVEIWLNVTERTLREPLV